MSVLEAATIALAAATFVVGIVGVLQWLQLRSTERQAKRQTEVLERQTTAVGNQATASLAIAEAAQLQAYAARQQVAQSVDSQEQGRRQQLIAAMPLVSARSIRRRTEPPRVFLGFELVCESPAPALRVRARITGLADQRKPLAGAQAFTGAQIPILGPGRSQWIWIEPIGSARTDDGEIGYEWMSLQIDSLGILGAKGVSFLEFAPNDAPDKDQGEPGFGERFVFRLLEVDLDGTGADMLVLDEDGGRTLSSSR